MLPGEEVRRHVKSFMRSDNAGIYFPVRYDQIAFQ